MVSVLDIMDEAVQVQALSKNIVLCYWARQCTLIYLHPGKRVLEKLMLGGTLRWTSIPSRGKQIEILSVTACY